jgi:hypothetical protein
MSTFIFVLLFAKSTMAQEQQPQEREPTSQEQQVAKPDDRFVDVDQLMKQKGEEVKYDPYVGEGAPAD